jgi:hypothetical protein
MSDFCPLTDGIHNSYIPIRSLDHEYTRLKKARIRETIRLEKQIGFAVAVNIVAAGLLYLPCEIAYRFIYDIPIQISGDSPPEDSRQFDDLDMR